MKIIAISDVHGKWNKLEIPECDLLISTGDYSFKGERHMVKDFHKWLDKQPAKHIISGQGNHELAIERNFNEYKLIANEASPRTHFIDEGLVEIEGVKIWCSAWTPFFMNWAWNAHPAELEKIWARIPDDIDIVASHGPPYGILDELVYMDGTPNGKHVGCPHLRDRIATISPDLHFFGHIHAWGGRQYHKDGVSYYNASICDEQYDPSNPITIVDYTKD